MTVLGVGTGTFLFIFFGALLLLILLIGHNYKIGQIIFWVGLIVFIITFGLLAASPTEKTTEDIVDRYYVLIIASIFILLGFVVALVAFILVVLVYQDVAITIPT